MVTPPNPGLVGKFLTDVTVCTFDADAKSLRDADGLAKTIVLTQGAAGGSSVEWAVADVGSTCPAALLDQRTFEVLTRGTLGRDGSIAFENTRYRVLAVANYLNLLCAAVPE